MELISKIKKWFSRTFVVEKVVIVDKSGGFYTLDDSNKLKVIPEDEKTDK